MAFNFGHGLYKKGEEIAPAAPPQKLLSGIAPPPPPGLSADQAGVLNQYAGNKNDPYYQKWEQGIKSNALAGSPFWFFDKYKENAQGQDAIAKQAEIAKQLASYSAGQAAQGVQANMAGAGLSKSGFMAEPMADIAGQEKFAFEDIYNRMRDMQQSHSQGLQDRWQSESFMKKAENNQKRNRKLQVASTALSVPAMILGAV